MVSSDLNEDIMARLGILVLLGNNYILVYYPIIAYHGIKFYMLETVDIVGFLCNNGVSVK